MADRSGSIRSVLLPLADSQLVLPNTAVAEIVAYREPSPIAHTPGWLLGTVEWRHVRVPLVSFEVIYGSVAIPPVRNARIVVCNTLNGNGSVPYIGFVTANIPRLIRIDSDSLTVGNVDAESNAGVLRQVEIYGEGAIIPDLDMLEAMCLEQLGEIDLTVGLSSEVAGAGGARRGSDGTARGEARRP